MSDFQVKSASPDFLSSGMERLRGPKSKSIEEEKGRLKIATQEFESFFTYQMLKTMRQTVPESPFAKESPMTTNMGKDMFTDMFDLEIARKMSSGKNESIADILYKSLEKLVQKEFDAEQNQNVEIKPLSTNDKSFIGINKAAVPVTTSKAPIPLEQPNAAGIELKFQTETENAQDVSKKPKAP